MSSLPRQFCDKLAEVCKQQYQTSRTFKLPRLQKIKKIEEFYAGNVTPDLKLPFNFCFPIMSGFIDHMMSKIDDAPLLAFSQQGKADYHLAEKIQAAYENEYNSSKPNVKWKIKDRHAKKNALYSGRAIMKYWANSPSGEYKSNLEVVSHYDFHCEPAGGGILENHLFKGQEGIFKTREELLLGAKKGRYDIQNVVKLTSGYTEEEYKDNNDDYGNRQNKAKSLGLDPVTNNYTGQNLFKLLEWFPTYNGESFYVVLEHHTGTWIRCVKLIEEFSNNESPFLSWSTNEEHDVFWNKGPGDDTLAIAEYANRALNQELYNREKKNRGQRAFDPEVFLDVDALEDSSVDSLVPAKVKPGKSISSSIYEFQVGGIDGTINLVEYLDGFFSKKTGDTSSSAKPSDKVGIYYGEQNQVNEFIGTKNKSYTEFWEEFGRHYAYGLIDNLDEKGMEIQLMGPNGKEWSRLSKYELQKGKDISLNIKIAAGAEDKQLKEMEKERKIKILSSLATVNPVWKDMEMMRSAGYTEEEIKEAFSVDDPMSKRLKADAYQAIEDIEQGCRPRMNRDANTSFIQTIIDYAKGHDMDDAVFNELYSYAMSHIQTVVNNTARSARLAVNEFMNKSSDRMMAADSSPKPGAPIAPVEPNSIPASNSPISVGLNASNAMSYGK